MDKFIKWATLGGALCGLVFIFMFYAANPKSIFDFNHKNLIGLLLTIGMFILIYQTASSLLGFHSSGSNIKNASIKPASARGGHRTEFASKETDPVVAALRKNPVLTVILILFGISLPVLFQLSAPRPGGRQFSSADWPPIVAGEVIVAIIVFVAWYRVRNLMRKKNGDRDTSQ
jgi:O-antigen/teichoic acid export membrane protein